MRTDIEQKKDLILSWIEEGCTKAFISKELKCKPETLNRYLDKWVLSIRAIKVARD